MPTCAFLACHEASECCLGSCVVKLFPQPASLASRPLETQRDDAAALNGTKSRAVRDPAKIKRTRKPLQATSARMFGG